MSDYEPGLPPPPVVAEDERRMALLSHVLAILFGFIPPLIIWLVNKDASPAKPFVVDQAKEALNFQITVLLAVVLSCLLMIVVIGFLLLPAVALVNLVFCIIAAIKANDGERYRYPLTLRLIS